MHKVVIPLDGSPFSARVLPYVSRLLDPASHSLILLRVGEMPAGVVSAPPRPVATTWPKPAYETEADVRHASHPIYSTQAEHSARAQLEAELLTTMLELRDAGYDVRVEVRFGAPAEEIVELAREQRADLVAMATHGWSGLRHLVLGSVAEQVLRTVPTPVLLVRPFDDAVSWSGVPTAAR